MKECEKRAKTISDSVAGVPSVKSESYVPEIANHVPTMKITWDQEKVKITPREAMQKLREGEPSIEASTSTNKTELHIGVWMLEPGEAQVVARRVREVLKAAV